MNKIFSKILIFSIIFIASDAATKTEQYANNDGIEIFYVDYGPTDNEPILLVQGLGGQLTFWPDELIELLQNNGFRPIVYDNRDVGLSDGFEEYGRPNFIWNYVKFYTGLPLKSAYSLADMASDGIAVLDDLELAQSHLLAMSMGGMITQRMVADNRERFKSYVLIASMARTPDLKTGPKGELKRLIEDRSFREQTIEERLDRSLKMYKILGTPGTEIDEEEFKKNALLNIERSSNESGFTRQLIAILADKDRYNEVRSITNPTLVIHGRLDPLIPFEEGKKTADMIPNSQFLPVDIMSHLIDEPVLDIIEEPLVKFLTENN
tara:strand:+ start:3447 stop:4412 length:966 start_codon:yes stop_codon:yes gene_type:complete